MKKTFPANISGKIYYIDEDAYALLQNYFTQLRASFPGEEGREIVSDIEGRVAELFEDKLATGQAVITLDDANEVITRMGRPEELSDEDEEHPQTRTEEAPFISINLPGRKRLYRDTRNKVFGGVVSGLAEYLGWNCNIMRLLLVVLALFSPMAINLSVGFWFYVVLYLVLWMIIPPASTSRRILEMQGRPVTVDGVGQTVLDASPGATPPPFDNPVSEPSSGTSGRGFWGFVSQCVKGLGKCVMLLLLVLGAVAGITAIVFLILGASALILGQIYGNYMLASNMGMSDVPLLCSYQLWVVILASLVAFVPCVALVWTACCVLFNSRGASSGVIITAVVLEVLLISALVVMCNLMFAADAICALSAGAISYIA